MNKFLCTTLIAVAASPLAQAEDFYVGMNVNAGSKGRIQYSDDGGGTERSASQSKLAAGIFAGYVLTPSWALEAGYRGQGGDSVFDLTRNYQLRTRTSMGYLAARNTWQLSDSWALYGKLGVAQGRFRAALSGKEGAASETVHKTGLYLGVGAAYVVNQNVALQLELEHTDKLKQHGLTATMDKLSLGVKVGF